MEKKPNKKEELTLVNNVLKLATKLLKVRIKLKMIQCTICCLALYLSLCIAYFVSSFHDYPILCLYLSTFMQFLFYFSLSQWEVPLFQIIPWKVYIQTCINAECIVEVHFGSLCLLDYWEIDFKTEDLMLT
jgi:hypothetical protein